VQWTAVPECKFHLVLLPLLLALTKLVQSLMTFTISFLV